jgi:hypothetical protein
MAKKAKKKLRKKVPTRPHLPLAKRLKKKKKAYTRELLPTAEEVRVLTTPEKLAGSYCNIANISHTKREFIVDFFFAFKDQTSLISRVITSPQHIKKIYEALETNIEKYEKRFGEI